MDNVIDKTKKLIDSFESSELISKLDYYKSIKVRSFRLELLDENYQEVINLIDKIRK